MAFTVGQTLTATALNGGLVTSRVAYASATESINNTTTLTSSNFLALSVVASSIYTVEMGIFYDAVAAADFKCSFLLSGGGGWLISPWGQDTTATAAAGSVQTGQVNTAAWTYGAIGAGTVLSARPWGQISTSSAGTVTFQYAQNTANASFLSLDTGSFMRLTKVA